MQKFCELSSFFPEKGLKPVVDVSPWLAQLTCLDSIEKKLIA